MIFGIQESGNFMESFTSKHLRPDNGHVIDAEEEDTVKWASGAMSVGGADTVSTLRYPFRRLAD